MKRILILTCAFAAILAAQAPPGDGEGWKGRRGRGGEALKTALGLDDAQIQQLRDARRAGFEGQRDIMEQIREKSQAMKALVEGANPDPAQIGALTLEIRALKQKAEDNRDAAHQQLVNLVAGMGAAEKLAELQAAAELSRAVGEARALGLLEGGPGPGKRGFGRRGPGGPRMGGPGPGGPPQN